MNNKISFLGIGIILVFFLLGCTSSGFNATDIAKLDPAVSSFLTAHPNAEIKAVFISQEVFDGMKDTVAEQCGINLPSKEYWRVIVTDKNTQLKIITWIDINSKNVVCIVKEGSTFLPDTNTVTPIDTNTGVSVDSNIINSGDSNTTLPTDNNTTLPVSSSVDRVKVGNVYASVAQIELNSEGTQLSSIKLRLDNETDIDQSISKKISMSVLNDKNEVVDTSTYQASLSETNLKGLRFTTLSNLFLYEDLSPGTYVVKIGFYNEGSNNTSTYLTKQVSIGADSDKVIIYPRKVESYTANEVVTLGQVKVYLEKVQLDSYGTNIDEFGFRVENQSNVDQSISKELGITVLNDLNEVVDVSTYQPTLSLSTIKELQLETSSNLFLYEELSPGTYTILVKFYNEGSAKSSTYITKKVQIGPDELQVVDYPKKVMTYSVTAGDIVKVTLDSYGTSVSSYKYTISGISTSEKVISAIMLNDKNEVVDVASYAQSINSNNVANNVFSINNSFLYAQLPNGVYTMLVEIYNNNSSVPGYVMKKSVTISPDAEKDQ